MARYVLVQVDENDRADRLREKLDAVPGLIVVGMFGKPMKFCECEVPSDHSKKGRKYGWWCCPRCGYPKWDALQSALPNLLEDGIPAQYRNSFLTIREPYLHPMGRTGLTAIAAKLLQIATTTRKNARRRTRRPRARRK